LKNEDLNSSGGCAGDGIIGEVKKIDLDDGVDSKEDSVEKNSSGSVKDIKVDMFSLTVEEKDSDIKEESKSDIVLTVSEIQQDSDGYYNYRIHDILGDRYETVDFLGKGVYSNVICCRDVTNNNKVAIKILRSKEIMIESGRKEVSVLKMLRENDKECKYNVINLLDHFENSSHLFLVFEYMDTDLRKLLKSYGPGIGLNIDMVREYGFKLIQTLQHLKNNSIIHADIKPDNILIGKDNTLKLGDFGSSFSIDEDVNNNDGYIASRYYRSPEIIVGKKFTYEIDMFSFGCCLYEMATGKPLFRSSNSNHHLKLILQTFGKVPKHFKGASKFSCYFTPQFQFKEKTKDLNTNKEIIKVCNINKIRNIQQDLNSNIKGNNKTKNKFINLSDLILQCVDIDPNKRLTPEKASLHVFF